MIGWPFFGDQYFRLNLGNNKIRQEGIEAIAQMLRENSTLTVLQLGHNGSAHSACLGYTNTIVAGLVPTVRLCWHPHFKKTKA